MTEIPDSIQIGGHTINIVRKAALVDDEECYGTFDATALEITIDDQIPQTLAWETFWHEVVEALNVFAETDLEHHHIQVMGLLLHQVASSIPALKHAETTPKIEEIRASTARKAAKAKAPSHKKRG